MAHYPLEGLRNTAKIVYPDGETFALKRAILPIAAEEETTESFIARLIVVNTDLPGSGVSYCVRDGIKAARLDMQVTQLEWTEVTRPNPNHAQVQAAKLAGHFILRGEHISAIAACVPGELATGFVHVTDEESITALREAF
jgi:hypothetical protein